MSRARELSRLGNPNIISADADFNVGFGTLTPRAKVDTVGVVSATSFFGDGSTLSNIASAGIGTALSDEKTSPLNQLFYTNQSLTIGVSTTIDPPTSGSLGYSQASDIEVADDVELTVADGDVFMVDVLGITTDPTVGATVDNNYLFSTVYADNITNQAGTGAPDASQGFKISKTTESTNSISGALIVSGGVGIAKSLHVGGNVSVGGTLTYEDVTNVDVVGLATYRSGAKFGVAGVGGTITGTGNVTFAGIVTASMPASNITSGIVTSARLGGGSASASTYLQGDGQWGSISSGLSEIDYWQTTNSWNSSTQGDNIITGAGGAGGVLARVGVSSGFGDAQGTGMSHSSGVWTFPSTGYWEVNVNAKLTLSGGTGIARAMQQYTSDNSTYKAYYGSGGDGGGSFTRPYKISDTSNQKIKLGWNQTNTNTDVDHVFFFFKKLA